jgi:prepilin-type N-terminal cleavage/methylation domain-containing protein
MKVQNSNLPARLDSAKRAGKAGFKIQSCKKESNHRLLMINTPRQNWAGFTLIEMLMVLFIFAIVGVLVTQSLVLSLRGSKKSESLGVVRENVDYAMNVMERRLRSADSLDCSVPNVLTFTDSDGTFTFSCSGGAILIDVDRLTSDEISIDCGLGIFSNCIEGGDTPDSIEINITAMAVDGVGAEGAQYSSSTKILLRNY